MPQSKKNILLISPFFFPEPISTGKYNAELIKALKNDFNQLYVICSHPFYPEWKVTASNKGIEGVKIFRGGRAILYPKNRILRRLILELWFACFVLIKFLRLRKKIDVIIPVFPPTLAFFILSFLIRKETKTIGIIHDLQEVYSSTKRGIINKIITQIINKIEGRALKQCNKLIFLSNEMKNTALKLYKLEQQKLKVCYPFITLKEQPLSSSLESIFTKEFQHIVYSGALSEKQNPKQLYAFFEHASRELKNCRFHFFSRGPIFESLKKKNKNESIEFHDLVEEEHILELYQRSTVQLIPQLPSTSKGSLPSKLPNILASGCNVLVITDEESEIQTLFIKNNLDSIVTEWDNKLLLNKLKEILIYDKNKSDYQTNLSKELFDISLLIDEITDI